MPRPAIEVADILRGLGPALRDGLSRDQHRAVNAILACRTAALGGHVSRCEDCGTMDVAYNSCLMGISSNGELAAIWRLFHTFRFPLNSPLRSPL